MPGPSEKDAPRSRAKVDQTSRSKAKTRAKTKTSGRRAKADLDLGTDKLYFKIGEVSEIIGVAAHVLRYWESEFSVVKPQKSRSQQRVYRRRDVENLLRIKQLLYERKFTIAGARQELRLGAAKTKPAAVSGVYQARQSLGRVREQLDLLAQALRSDPLSAAAADPSAYAREARAAREAERPALPLIERTERTEHEG